MSFCSLFSFTRIAVCLFLLLSKAVSALPTADISAKFITLSGNKPISYGSAPSLPAILSKLTISFWIKSETLSDAYLFSMGRSATDYDGEIIVRTDSSGLLWVWEFSKEAELGSLVATKTSILTGKFVHLTIVKDGVNTAIYINGQLEAHTTADSLVYIKNNNITVGGDIRDDTMHLVGELNSFSLYSTALTTAEVAAVALVPPVVPSPQPFSSPAAPVPPLGPNVGPAPPNSPPPNPIVQSFILVTKAGAANFANCDGIYVTNGFLNERPVYVNDAKSRWIGWNGKTWVIVDSKSYTDFLSTQVSGFEGYHLSTNGDIPSVMEILWDQYDVTYRSFALDATPTGGNYAYCEGVYAQRGKLHGRPVFVNDVRLRWIGWNGKIWVLTSMNFYTNFLTNQTTGFGGFHFNLNGDVSIYDTIWQAYTFRIV